jgi:hypothetical protein
MCCVSISNQALGEVFARILRAIMVLRALRSPELDTTVPICLSSRSHFMNN